MATKPDFLGIRKCLGYLTDLLTRLKLEVLRVNRKCSESRSPETSPNFAEVLPLTVMESTLAAVANRFDVPRSKIVLMPTAAIEFAAARLTPSSSDGGW